MIYATIKKSDTCFEILELYENGELKLYDTYPTIKRLCLVLTGLLRQQEREMEQGDFLKVSYANIKFTMEGDPPTLTKKGREFFNKQFD